MFDWFGLGVSAGVGAFIGIFMYGASFMKLRSPQYDQDSVRSLAWKVGVGFFFGAIALNLLFQFHVFR
jgi:hypothetical protein